MMSAIHLPSSSIRRSSRISCGLPVVVEVDTISFIVLKPCHNGYEVVKSQSGTYIGPTRNGKAYGQGELIAADGSVYRGQFIDNRFDGKGMRQAPDGYVYEGQYKRGEEHGEGKVTWPSGATYEGGMAHGLMHGWGIWKDSDGEEYIGDWIMGESHGHGWNKDADGNEYDGMFEHNHRNGQGVMTYADGRKYNGQWQAGKKHGKGTETIPDGSTFAGEWVNGLKHGVGTFTDASPGSLPIQQHYKWDIAYQSINHPIKPPGGHGLLAETTNKVETELDVLSSLSISQASSVAPQASNPSLLAATANADAEQPPSPAPSDTSASFTHSTPAATTVQRSAESAEPKPAAPAASAGAESSTQQVTEQPTGSALPEKRGAQTVKQPAQAVIDEQHETPADGSIETLDNSSLADLNDASSSPATSTSYDLAQSDSDQTKLDRLRTSLNSGGSKIATLCDWMIQEGVKSAELQALLIGAVRTPKFGASIDTWKKVKAKLLQDFGGRYATKPYSIGRRTMTVVYDTESNSQQQ